MKPADTTTDPIDADRHRRVDEPRGMVLVAVWAALVAVGVVGRLWQPGWNVTPMAGVALAAGAAFPHPLVAASVPLMALAIGNLSLPEYGSVAMAVVVYAATIWPIVLGRSVLRAGDGRGVDVSGWSPRRWSGLAGSALASSLVFFLTTNLAHWWLSNDYPHTGAGLLACYVAALPFYRWMPVGDLAWSAVIFTALSVGFAAVRASRAAAAA